MYFCVLLCDIYACINTYKFMFICYKPKYSLLTVLCSSA